MTITRNFSVLANGAGSANNLSLGGATIGTNALAVTGTTALSGLLTAAGGVSSTLVTDATSATTGSIITAGGISTQKALWVGTTTTLAGALTYGGVTLSNAVTGTGNMMLSANPTTTGTLTAAAITGTTGVFSGRITATGSPAGAAQLRLVDSGGSGHTWDIGSINATGNLDFRDLSASGSPIVATLTSIGLGIGMTPSNVLDITQSQNAASQVKLLNSNGSSGAQSNFFASNGTNTAQFGVWGTGATTSGAVTAGNAFVYGDNGISYFTGGTHKWYISTNTEAMRLNSNGNLGIGITGISATLAIQQPNGQDNVSLFGYANTGSLTQIGFYNLARVFCGQIYIDAAGHTTTYATSSNADLKDVALDQSNYRQKIQDLWVGDYSWKDTGAVRFGVLAQQVHEVLGGESGFAFQPAKSDGNWSVSSEPFAFLALWGVKDLYAENEALKARLTALENK